MKVSIKSTKRNGYIHTTFALFLVLSLLTSLFAPAISAFATKSVGTVQAAYTGTATDGGTPYGNYMNHGSSEPNSRYRNAHPNQWFPKKYVSADFKGQNGKSGAFYCIMPSKNIPKANNYATYTVYQLTDSTGKVLYDGTPKNVFSDQKQGAGLKKAQQIQLLRILMMYTSPSVPNTQDHKYAAGQALTWEILVGERKTDFSHVAPDKGYVSAAHYGGTKSTSAYNDLVKKVQAHIEKYGLSDADAKAKNKTAQFPSFASGTQTLKQNRTTYTTTLTDTNNVLSHFKATSSDKNLQITQKDNSLTITTTSPPAEGKSSSITLTSTDSNTNSGILYLLHSSKSQDGILTVKSPMTTSFKVQAPTKEKLDPLKLEIQKKSSDASTSDNLSGAVFETKWYKSGVATGSPDGVYDLTTKEEVEGTYVADLANAETVSGEEIPISDAEDNFGESHLGFPDGSLLVISEKTPPANYKGTPTWTVESGTNATVVGDTVQIKISSGGSSATASDVKLTATDTPEEHFGFSTSLLTSDGKDDIDANQSSTVSLVDTITIDDDAKGIDGASGTIVGQLYDETTHKPVGSPQTLQISNIKPGAQYSQKFTVDISQYKDTGKGTTFYADETITLNKDGKAIKDSPFVEKGEDELSQQISITSETPPEDTPEMHTSLSSSNGGSGTINRSKSTTLSDAVTISGVGDKLKGTNAILTSTLVGPNGTIDTKTQPIQLGNKTISQSFKAFDSTDTAKYPTDKPVYANEEITYKDANGQEQTFEENGEEEESQQVTFPDTPIPALGTTLTNKQTHNQTFTPGGKISLVDTVSYENLTAGESYTLEGTLMDKETQSELKDSSGNPVTGKVTFTASAANGKQDMSFDFNIDANFDHEVVAYETLKDKTGKEIAVHKDINAITQTVTPTPKPETPEISTSVKSKGTGDQLDNATKEVNLVDTVHYSGLEGNTKYVMQGTLMHRSTGTAIQKGGKDLTNTVEFTTTASGTGDVEVPFTFNAKDIQLKGQPLNLAGQDIVVFEKVYKPGTTTIIARHEDRNDTHQIVHFPSGHTNARDAETLTQNSNAGKKVTIKDVVTYNNLIPGKTYTMTGTAYRKDTGKPLTDHGKVVSNTISFTPSSANGSVVVPVTFDASLLQGKRIVMFESCKYRNYEVFVHADINDHDQTVYIPELHTVAANSRDGSHKVGVGNVKIADKVSYTNLIPGQEYTVEGVLMNKDTGNPVVVDGKQVTGTATFTAKQATGYQVVDFKVDTSKIGTKHLVVFETLYTGNHKEVGHHKDIHDEDQAIIVTETVRTGGFPIVPVAVGAGVVVLGAGLYFVFRKKKHPHTTD